MQTPFNSAITDSISEMSVVTNNLTKPDIPSTDDKGKKKRTRSSKNSAESGTKAAATTAAFATFTLGQVIAGVDGKPDKESNEENNMINAYEIYLKSKDITDVPPGLSLCIVLLAYGIRIIKVQRTQSKIEKIKDFFKGMFVSKNKIKLNKVSTAVNNIEGVDYASQSYNRND